MRAHLFVSALFAVSLFGGAALADRPGEDGGRTGRMPNMRELRVRETREAVVRERPHETPATKVRDPQVMERLRSRGDMVDRTGGSRAAGSQTKASVAGDSAKAQRAAEKALRKIEEKRHNAVNCSVTDDSCNASARSAAAAARAGQEAQRAENNRQRKEIQKMVDKVRAEKMREKLSKMMCEKHANTCAENL
ncbi:MAG: hypothetical protein IPK82_15120 [Polyangiaceae bacterium]|nr:hypothetical protein [Polyangiaceae bacterium]